MLSLSANAKINLFLEITGKRSDGYHTVETVMQEISLADGISLRLLPRSEGIKLKANISTIPLDERNIAYKAASKYIALSSVDCGVEITLNKKIPHEAGMGGGSSDGAAVLAGLNELCSEALNKIQMHNLGHVKYMVTESWNNVRKEIILFFFWPELGIQEICFG